MQTFETEEPFTAHAAWSQMTPRITRPPGITLVDAMVRPSLRLAGTTLVVRPGERVLFVFDDKPAFQVAREVTASRIDILAGHIDLDLKPHLLLSDEPNRKLAQGLEALRDDIATHPTPVSDGLLILIASYMLGGSAADGSALAARIQEVATTAAGKAQAGKVKGAFDEIRGAIPVIDLNAAAGPSSLDDVLVAVNRAPPAAVDIGPPADDTAWTRIVGQRPRSRGRPRGDHSWPGGRARRHAGRTARVCCAGQQFAEGISAANDRPCLRRVRPTQVHGRRCATR
jgi:hypothetical protein